MKRKTRITWQSKINEAEARAYARGYSEGALAGANKQIEQFNSEWNKKKEERLLNISQLIIQITKLL